MRCQKKLEDPPRLVDEAEVRKMALLVCRCENGHQGWRDVEVVAFAFVRDVGRAGLGAELSETFEKLPGERVVVVNCTVGSGRRVRR